MGDRKTIAEVVFPTGVGMNRAPPRPTLANARVPHGRGDEPANGPAVIDMLRCSPRAWG